MQRFVLGAIGCLAIGALLLTAACTTKNNNTLNNAAQQLNPNGATVIVPTRVPSNTPIPPSQRTGAVLASPAAIAATGAQHLTEIATDDKYSQTSFTVKAGQPIELTLNNNGQAIHNWHLLNVKDVDGKDIATPLVEAGQSATIDFTINTPGKYDFHCDVHPTEMTGTLTVQ